MQTKGVKKFPADANILRGWLDSIPFGQYNAVKWRIVDTCEVPMTTLNNWIYGTCRIPDERKIILNGISKEISGKELFDI